MADRLMLDNLIYPLFVRPGKGLREEISSMPGVYRFSPDKLIEEGRELQDLGIKKILLFGTMEEKDISGSMAYKDDNVVAKAVATLKKHFPEFVIMTDICLCAYTTYGHCGILKSETPMSIDKEPTLSVLAKIALMHANAGADYVAPSAMAKDQVRVIRSALNAKGYEDTKIMGYSAKFASGFYGPFRDAADSAPQFGNREQYQLSYHDRERALAEIEDDISEGADIVMIKPALAYLDIIREAKIKFGHHLAAYNVSGEYAMVKAAAQSGYCDEKSMVFEIMASIQRAGADIIITYHARDIAAWLKEEERADGKKTRT